MDIAEEKRYTYAMLKREIDCMAYALIKLGFKKGDRIGIFLPNSHENVVFTYVASKIGLVRVGFIDQVSKPLLSTKSFCQKFKTFINRVEIYKPSED